MSVFALRVVVSRKSIKNLFIGVNLHFRARNTNVSTYNFHLIRINLKIHKNKPLVNHGRLLLWHIAIVFIIILVLLVTSLRNTHSYTMANKTWEYDIFKHLCSSVPSWITVFDHILGFTLFTLKTLRAAVGRW